MRKCGLACLVIAMAAVRPAEPALTAQAQVPDGLHAACAAFASDGGSVTATFYADALWADLTDAAGNVSQLTLPFDDAPTKYTRTHSQYHTCKAHFDRGNDLFAVGMTYGVPNHYLYVAVADAVHRKWLGHWTVGPESRIYVPRLEGFLGSNPLVGGEPFTTFGAGVGVSEKSFVSLVFEPNGRPLGHGPIERTYALDDTRGPMFVDVAHNRLWTFPGVLIDPKWSHQPERRVGWVAMTGDTASGHFTPRTAGDRQMASWMWPGSFVAPDTDTIAVAEGRRIWLAHVSQQTLERIELPRRLSFPNREELVGAASASPDGRIAVFPLQQQVSSLFSDWAYNGTDFAVVDLAPLRLLQIVRGGGPRDVTACAAEHSQGRVSLLVFRDERWERARFIP